MTRYAFVQPQLADMLAPEQAAALAERGLASPTDLRLALWDRVNEQHSGFIAPIQRERVLTALAEEWGLPPDTALVDRLLSLDSDAVAVLTPTGERPTAQEMMRLYNRGAVQTLLAHSTQVALDMSRLPGTALKRLYFLAKRRGVLVDVAENEAGGFTLTLFGPEQAFGSADKYGRRLAEVSLSLLRRVLSMPESVQVRATASLILHDRPYRFHVTPEILQRLEYAPESAQPLAGRVAEARAAYSVGSAVETADDEGVEEPTFDSMVEARLYREFTGLQRQGYSHGWLLQREPEPVLAPGLVMIPDFAFVRGDAKVYMEIAGFWSPTYRQRKVAKLRTLASHGDGPALVLAVPQDAAQAFAGLPFHSVPYKTHVRATDVLGLLDAHYGQREERLDAAQSQFASLQEAARQRGLVPEQEIAQALQAYTRSELLALAASLSGDGCSYVPGVGLLSDEALERATSAVQQAVAAAGGRLSLDDAARVAAEVLGALHLDIEALAQVRREWRIERPSLFEAYLVAEG